MLQVEKLRLFLRLRERLRQSKVKLLDSGEKKNAYPTPVSPSEPKTPIPDKCDFSEHERDVVERVLKLIKRRIPMNREPPTGGKVSVEHCSN